MSHNRLISAVTSTLQRNKPQVHTSFSEQDRLIPPKSSQSPFTEEGNGDITPTQTNYGSTTPSRSAKLPRSNSERFDGNDADLWQGVQTGGLDGRGSILSKDQPDEGTSRDGTGRLKNIGFTRLRMMYLFVPITTSLFFYALVALAQYAWPPSASERRLPEVDRPIYPHPFLIQSFAIGVLSSMSMGAIRNPIRNIIGRILDSLRSSPQKKNRNCKNDSLRTFATGLGILLATILSDLLRVFTLYLCNPTKPLYVVTTTQLFQQSYFTGLGWGLAEAFWGIATGWFNGLSLWKDLLGNQNGEPVAADRSEEAASEDLDGDEGSCISSLAEDEDNLMAKIEMLETIRDREELEDALGVPFPNVPIAVHILWRIDTLLFNLGLTLLLSAFYYDAVPIYRRPTSRESSSLPGSFLLNDLTPNRWFPLVLTGVIVVHFAVTWIWASALRRVGLSAVTWASLIISLGSVFAGLGSWGALV